MKNKYIFVLSFISFLIISCSNLMDAREETPADTTPAAYTVSGKLVTEYESNVGPRSAFPANNINLALYTTKFYYKSSPTATERTLCGTTTDSSFELKLPSLGTYYLEAESYRTSDGTKTVAFKTTSPVELTLTEEAPFKNNVRMLLHIVVEEFDEDDLPYGYIKLKIKYVPEIVKVTKGYVYDSGIQHESEIYIDDNNIWEQSGLLARPNTFVFKFFNAEDELVYQCYESVTVFPGKTTDTWVNNGNAEYFSPETIDGKDVLVMNITQDCLDNFALTNFYVKANGDDNNNGSYFTPFRTLDKALSKCTVAGVNYTINIDGTVEVRNRIIISKNILIKKAEEATSAKIKYLGTPERLFTVQTGTFTISNVDIEGPDDECDFNGAAIFNEGTLILNNVNFSKFKNTGIGGCLYNAGDGTISITGGSITSCASNQGGAIYNDGKDIEIKDCTISSCTAQRGGAIYNDKAKKIKLSGNTSITRCTAAEYGGGIYLYSYAKVYMQDSASIKKCTATKTSGSGIYASGTECRVDMKDSAYLDSASDIYLNTGASVTLNGNLTPPEATRGIAATITPNAYTGGIQILDENTIGLIAGNYLKFALTSTDEDPSIQWTIDNTGKLKKEVLVSSLTAAPTDTNAVYKLSTVADLSKIAGWVNDGVTLVDIKFELTSDITIDSTWTPIGHYEYGNEKYFMGHFDGLGHTITYNTENVGQNFAFIGALQNGSVSNLNATGTIRGTNATYTSPIVGYIEDSGNISNCTSSVDMELSSSGFCGGIVGYVCIYNAGEIIIENCINTGNITCERNSVGGIAGAGYGGVFKNCINNGNITASAMASGIVGQIRNNPTVTNCGNTGDITVNWVNEKGGNSGAGGIVAGANSNNAGWGKATITNCWSTGTIQSININSNCAGGIYGNFSTLTRNECISSNCYYLSGSCDRAVGNIEGPVEEILIFTGTQNNYTVNGTDFVDILNQNVSGEMKRWKYGTDGYPVFE
ncbi:MAG: hypothetical protein MJ176_05565 [Treponema sp.]|nr:hypothetical protein [Treponema sp.]